MRSGRAIQQPVGHPSHGQPRTSPGWPLTLGTMRQLDAGLVCRACPRLVAWREKVAGEARGLRRRDLLGTPGAGLRRRRRAVLIVGLAPPRTGQSHRPRVHRRPLGRLALRRAAPRRLANQPTSTSADDGLALTGRVHHRGRALRAAGNKPTPAERDRCWPWLARELARSAACARSSRSARSAGTACCRAGGAGLAGPRPRPAFGHGARCRCRRAGCAVRLLPCQPAEHVHRPPDRADARRRVRPGDRPRRYSPISSPTAVGGEWEARRSRPGSSSSAAATSGCTPRCGCRRSCAADEAEITVVDPQPT